MIERQFNPDALVVARESREATQSDIAKAIGTAQGYVSKIENGVALPSEDQVASMGEFLHYPTALFYESGPILQGKSGCLHHRKRKTLPAKVLNKLDGTMAVRLINARHLLNGLDVLGNTSFHEMDPDEYGSPEACARALRVAWRMPEGPVRNMVSLLEAAGGIILFTHFHTHKLFGMSQWTTADHPLFFLNQDVAMEELRWTLAHELGHLVMHGTPTSADLEEQADAFAGEFLAPRKLLLPQLKGLTFSKLPALKAHWRISMKAIIKRGEVIGAISRETATRFYKQYSARRWHNAEPYPVDFEAPTLIRVAANVHLDEHGYTLDELGAAVRLYRDELMREFLGMESSGLSVVH